MTAALPQKKERSSNLELMRILLIASIVMHHYVVNSGVMMKFDGLETLTPQFLFLQFWGMWGKTAINSFILISGFFMCMSQLTWQKYLKLFLQVKFYAIVLTVLLILTGWDVLNLHSIKGALFGLSCYVNQGFTASFMAFYLFIPFMNKYIKYSKSGGYSACWRYCCSCSS